MSNVLPILVQSDSHAILRPEKYSCKTVYGICYICASGNKLIRQPQIDNMEDLLSDHLELLAKIKDVLGVWVDWKGFEITGMIESKLINDSKEQYLEMMQQFAQIIIPFYDKWGCYGIFWNNISSNSISMRKNLGRGFVAASVRPQSLTIIEQNETKKMLGFSDGLPHGYLKYGEYQKQFFPDIASNALPDQIENREAFFLNYCEPVSSIVFNDSVFNTILHMEMQKRNALFGENVSPTDYYIPSCGLGIHQQQDKWHYTWNYSGLLQAASILYADSLANNGKITYCKNPSCNRVFDSTGDRRKLYCSTECANAVRQRRKRINRKIKEASKDADKG